jgi:preprotein translocase subunit SecA
MRHFDVQLLGGMALFHGSIAEMDTGEGKTLTATLPLYLYGLRGKGAHLATVNDYLAARDGEQMAPAYQLLGLSTGVIQTDMSRPQRRNAYGSDITYGTAKEFGFDFLRDRLVLRRLKQDRLDFLDSLGTSATPTGERPVQRDPFFVLVDEADSILIDEARTPLIISAIGDNHEESIRATFEWSAAAAADFEQDVDYEYDHEKKKVELTLRGRQKVRAIPQPQSMSGVGLVDAYEYIERSIKVRRDFLRDQHYVVSPKGEIVIVDEFTGRHPPGDRSQGEAGDHGGHRAGSADHGAGPVPSLPAPGRHDRHRALVGPRVPSHLQVAGGPHSHESPRATPDPARPDFHQRRREVAADRGGGCRDARRQSARAHRYQDDREVRASFAIAESSGN